MARLRGPNDQDEDRSPVNVGAERGPDTFAGGLDQEHELNPLLPGLGDDSHGSETPRMRPIPIPSPAGGEGGYEDSQHNSFNPGSSATPTRPRSPSIGAGSQPMQASGGSTEGVMPFSPMKADFGSQNLATPGGGLFGSMGGLKGGGLGVPLDPSSNDLSDPIFSLINKLMQGF